MTASGDDPHNMRAPVSQLILSLLFVIAVSVLLFELWPRSQPAPVIGLIVGAGVAVWTWRSAASAVAVDLGRPQRLVLWTAGVLTAAIAAVDIAVWLRK